MIKLRQKCPAIKSTHPTGAKQFCTIRSYLSTAAKHDIRFFDALITLAIAKGHPWMPTAA